ncbi:MAG: hypothetical protein AAFP02_17620, partial [Bacteroidota bacterium]
MLRYLLLSLLLLPLLTQGQTKSCACCTELHQQFHFWVGDWEAFDKQSKKLGENRIVLMQDTCVMQENWTSGAYSGTSYNYYDSKRQQWHQLWIDNQGQILRLYGGMEEDKMILRSDEMTNAQGQTYINRVTWTPNDDGSVRQHWEASSDQGESWNTLFDGIYRPKS